MVIYAKIRRMYFRDKLKTATIGRRNHEQVSLLAAFRRATPTKPSRPEPRGVGYGTPV